MSKKKCVCGYAIGHPLVSKCTCKEWQGLSEQEINIIQGGFCKGQYFVPDLIKAIEQKLKEKNT